MSDAIYLTITETPSVTNLTITETAPLYINFYEVALPDARVTEERVAAQAAAVASEASAVASGLSASASSLSAANAATSLQAATENSIINALIFG